MLERTQADAAIYRVAIAAFTYYPERPEHEAGYTVDEDLDWCIRPLRHLPAGLRRDLRAQMHKLITDPSADRQAFIRELKALVDET
jgi:hypothetical protein